jgi:hypothetical protein
VQNRSSSLGWHAARLHISLSGSADGLAGEGSNNTGRDGYADGHAPATQDRPPTNLCPPDSNRNRRYNDHLEQPCPLPLQVCPIAPPSSLLAEPAEPPSPLNPPEFLNASDSSRLWPSLILAFHDCVHDWRGEQDDRAGPGHRPQGRLAGGAENPAPAHRVPVGALHEGDPEEVVAQDPDRRLRARPRSELAAGCQGGACLGGAKCQGR